MPAKSKKPYQPQKNSISDQVTRSSADQPRQIKLGSYRSFRLSKPIKNPHGKMMSAPKLFKQSLAHVWLHKRLFASIGLIFLLLNWVFVKGFGSTVDVALWNQTLSQVFEDGSGRLMSGLAIFGALLSSTGSAPDQAASLHQAIFFLLFSLVLIWVLRQTYAGNTVSVTDSFYKSTYPLVQFLLVICVIGLQLLPLALAGVLYGVVFGQMLVANAAESVLWLTLIGLLITLSLYMVMASLFAPYIVTLADVRPMQALRSARDLVRYRRWSVIRKVLFLPVVLLMLTGLIMVPIIIYLPSMAEFIFLVLTVTSVVVGHNYFYRVYRELL